MAPFDGNTKIYRRHCVHIRFPPNYEEADIHTVMDKPQQICQKLPSGHVIHLSFWSSYMGGDTNNRFNYNKKTIVIFRTLIGKCV